MLAYDSLPLEISGLHSSWWVPLLLGCFYVVAGSLQVCPLCKPRFWCTGRQSLFSRALSQQVQRLYGQLQHPMYPVLPGSAVWRRAQYDICIQVLLDEAVISPLQQQNASASLQDRVVGLLQQFEVFRSQGNRQQTERVTAEGAQLPAVALATGVTASLLALSAVLYVSDVPYPAMTAILAACAALNWRVFDGTRQGAFVAVLCGIAAPLSELVIIRLGLWHYLQPDLFGSQGVPQWVSCCYIFYTAPVSNLARTVLRQQ